jgi:hypothetical protein
MNYTFDSTDTSAAEVQKEAEAKALAEGERLIEQQQKAQELTYEQARLQEESQARFAGKYKSAEELEKAYLELQKKLGESKAPETTDDDDDDEAPAEEPVEADEGDLDEDEADESSELTQLLTDASKEFSENSSKLSEETIEKLSKLDSRTLVETWANYIAQQEQEVTQAAISQQEADRVMKAVGGEKEYQSMIAWAAENLSPAEVAAYDNVVNNGNADAVYWAAMGLKAKYSDAVGYEGKQVSGKRPRSSEPGFRSHSELARAIRDPRYKDDPAYRRDVEDKLSRSGDLL